MVAFIRNFTVIGTNYGVRAGQSSGVDNGNATLTIESGSLTALFPVWLRGDAPRLATLADTELTALEGGEAIRNDAGAEVIIES